MNLSSLIFSDKQGDRIKRHLIFWMAWYFYFALLHAANPFGRPEISYFRNPVFTFTESFFQVLPQIPLVYSMIYIVHPKFILPHKYYLAVFTSLLFWFMGGIIHLYWFRNFIPWVLPNILPARFIENTQRIESVHFFMAIMATYKGAFTITAFALLFKIGKDWYLKVQRNLQLQKENTETQMRLLTAQLHPHFLFNTLNNIYSQTQIESPKGSRMIMGLSDMLRYILYEGQKPLVPLKQELQMLIEYINLEKIRYGNKLDVHVLTPDNPDNLYIAPLLLLPFVENCFKHGASNILENPWINLTVEVKDSTIVMKLMNGKALSKENNRYIAGIGVNNVRQRMELLYKNKYDLQLREDDEVFVVDLRVELTKNKEVEQAAPIEQMKSAFTYA